MLFLGCTYFQSMENLVDQNLNSCKFTTFQNTSPPAKKVRKSLERKWSTPGDIALFGQTDGLSMIPETPVSLALDFMALIVGV